MPVETAVHTITFGDQGENGKGMQILGKPAERGLTAADLRRIAERFPEALLLPLKAQLPPEERAEAEDAFVLVVPGGVAALGADPDAILAELDATAFDERALMRKQIKTKRARSNTIFANEAQDPDLAAGKGTVHAFSTKPALGALRLAVEACVESAVEKKVPLIGEANKYFNPKTCGIGFRALPRFQPARVKAIPC